MSDEAKRYAEKRIAEMQNELSFACLEEQRKDMQQELEQAYTQGREDALKELDEERRKWFEAGREEDDVRRVVRESLEMLNKKEQER